MRSTFPPSFIENAGLRSLEARRLERTRLLGTQLATWGVMIACFGLITDLMWRKWALMFTDLLILAGCLASLAWRRLAGYHRLLWVPGFMGLWLGSFFFLSETGGLSGPYLGEYLLLIFAIGSMVQLRFSLKWVVYFTLSNAAFWVVATWGGALDTSVGLPPLLALSKHLIFGASAGIIVLSIFRTEELMSRESAEQAQSLSEAQLELTHSEKMAEIGSLVATAAHELAQPVQVISMSTSLMERMIKRGQVDPEELRDLVGRVADGSARLSRLLTQLRDFSRKEPFEPKVFDLREAVRSAECLAGFDLKSRGIVFETHISEEPLWVLGDSSRLQQVILNLVNNARDASSRADGPQVVLELQRCGRFLRLLVRNNGPEIPLAIQSRLFDSFFTTKKKGHGTGLGLTVVSRIVELHSGRIFFSSEPDNTVFVVDLPQAEVPELKKSLNEAPGLAVAASEELSEHRVGA